MGGHRARGGARCSVPRCSLARAIVASIWCDNRGRRARLAPRDTKPGERATPRPRAGWAPARPRQAPRHGLEPAGRPPGAARRHATASSRLDARQVPPGATPRPRAGRRAGRASDASDWLFGSLAPQAPKRGREEHREGKLRGYPVRLVTFASDASDASDFLQSVIAREKIALPWVGDRMLPAHVGRCWKYPSHRSHRSRVEL